MWRRRLILTAAFVLVGSLSLSQQVRNGAFLRARYCVTCRNEAKPRRTQQQKPTDELLHHGNNCTASTKSTITTWSQLASEGTGSERKPRVASFFYTDDKDHPLLLRLEPATFNRSMHANSDSSSQRNATTTTPKTSPPREPICVPNADWQTRHNPSCNNLHELPLNAPESSRNNQTSFHLLGSGAASDAWRISGSAYNHDPVVLKTLRYHRLMNDYTISKTQREAMILDRLSASPNVIDIYAFCGVTGMFEFADGGNLRDEVERRELPARRKLEIAVQAAGGVVDLHSTDYANRSTAVHMDIKADQIVSVKGRYKLNDFNIARFIKRYANDPSSNCPFYHPSSMKIGRDRSPEEALYKAPLTEKLDVYRFGNVLYTLLTRQMPFHAIAREDARALLANGTRPAMTHLVLASKDPVILMLRNATMWCHTFDPDLRPTMQAVLAYLQHALGEYTD